MYADAFHHTALVLPPAPPPSVVEKRTAESDRIHTPIRSPAWASLTAALYADLEWVDLRAKPSWDGVGKFDRLMDNVDTESLGAGLVRGLSLHDQRWRALFSGPSRGR